MVGSPLKYDPDLCGPQKHRSCTDIICLLLFLFFLAAWAGVASFAYRNGDPKRLILPVDSYGHRCGEPDLINPNLFFFDLTACLRPDAIWRGCSTPQVCVSKCPEDVWIAETYLSGVLQFNITDVQNHLICYNEIIVKTVVDKNTLQDVVNKKACASWYVPSQSWFLVMKGSSMSDWLYQRPISGIVAMWSCYPGKSDSTEDYKNNVEIMYRSLYTRSNQSADMSADTSDSGSVIPTHCLTCLTADKSRDE
ncbi:hypothetical protein J6590_019356 [Homalodisca vitripennis]|nr:hypothetical protein J6590_019356 [Homalodisca vitripennis]